MVYIILDFGLSFSIESRIDQYIVLSPVQEFLQLLSSNDARLCTAQYHLIHKTDIEGIGDFRISN